MLIKRYFDNINVLRGFAAITVVIFHVIELVKWDSFPTSGPLVWFRSGGMAVDFFFVISGFVVGMSTIHRLSNLTKDRKNWSFQKQFLIKRAARILPLYYLTMLVFIVFTNPLLIFEPAKNLILHLFFLHSFNFVFYGAINGPTWSLGPEVHFYVLLLLFGPWLIKIRSLTLAILCIGIAWLTRYIIFTEFNPQNDHLLWMMSSNILGLLDEFIIGFILARLVNSSWGEKLIAPILSMRLMMFALAAGLTWIAQRVYWEYAVDWGPLYIHVFYKTLLSLSFASIILFFCSFEPNGAIRKILSPFYYLGTISYGIYLWHIPIIESLNRVYGVPPTYFLMISLALTIIFASGSWFFFEKRIIEHFSSK